MLALALMSKKRLSSRSKLTPQRQLRTQWLLLTILGQPGQPAFTAEVRYRDTTTGSWTELAEVPAWLNPRVWIQQPLDNSFIPTDPEQKKANTAVWAVQLVIPLDTLAAVQPPNGPISIGDTFKMWYAMYVKLPADPA